MNFKGLVGKLNNATRMASEDAAGLCVSATHYNIEIEHYLRKLLEHTDNDATLIFLYFGMDADKLSSDLDRVLDEFKAGNTRPPTFSPALIEMLVEAWTIGSIDYGDIQIRSGHTILALVTVRELSRQVRESSHEFDKIDVERLRNDFYTIVAPSRESLDSSALVNRVAARGEGAPKVIGKTPNLDQFTVNLTQSAAAGKIDPVLGRDAEIRQIIDILMRRRQNNPILTGEAGVGKTAVVEGLALRIAQGDVPPPLRQVSLRSLDLALLQAGAGVKGEFESRLKGLIDEVKASVEPIILFIDEAHTMIGAGGQAGQNDAANLLKPALARGELRTIAATTWSEFKKYFEKDPALARRFQVVKVEEPEESKCLTMIRGILPSLEKHHQVRILDEGLAAAVHLSNRFLAGRQLPDKAVSILDTACARLALGQNSVPPAIEDCVRQIDDLAVQKRILEREAALGANHVERLDAIDKTNSEVNERLKELRTRFENENELVSHIRELSGKIESAKGITPAGTSPAETAITDQVTSGPFQDENNRASLLKQLEAAEAKLAGLQGETPMIRVAVDAQIVGEVISAWTGIPAGKMLKDEIATVLSLPTVLANRVIGQNHALEVISQRISTARARLDDPNKPIGVFMLVGPSGVGKTETALALSDLLYGGERNLITINMSEFQEAHTVSSLKGSPPGYVGYGEGGVLTEAVRRRPYSVVLLDEVEKAHPDVLEIFFQVFDKGVMEDGEGREIDFKNTVIILTTNAGTDTISKLCADEETMPSPDGLAKALKPELNKIFKPAFLGRLVIIPYLPIRDASLKQIIRLKLGKIKRRIHENHKISLTYDDALVAKVIERCTEVESGARNVDNILTNTLLPEVSRIVLGLLAGAEPIRVIHVGIDEGGSFAYTSTP